MSKATPSLKKRFWKQVSVAKEGTGYRVYLDSHALSTPAGRALIVPNKTLAEKICQEWDTQDVGQDKEVSHDTMLVTRIANSAIDKVAPNRVAVLDALAEYGKTDLLYYRAETPQELIARQEQIWGTILDWARRHFDAPFKTTHGVMFIEQPQAGVKRLRDALDGLDDFALAGAHEVIGLSGSLILCLALMEKEITPAQAWQAATLDEDWQAEQWGADEEASQTSAQRKASFLTAVDFLCI